MKNTRHHRVQIIAPDSYPPMVAKHGMAKAVQMLRSQQAANNAQAAIEACGPAMRDAVLQYVDALEIAKDNMARVFAIVHEIRGMAETVGLVTTGRIAEILCRYMDDMDRLNKPVDDTLVALNIAAIVRAARTEGIDASMGEAVAAELAALIARRLSDESLT